MASARLAMFRRALPPERAVDFRFAFNERDFLALMIFGLAGALSAHVPTLPRLPPIFSAANVPAITHYRISNAYNVPLRAMIVAIGPFGSPCHHRPRYRELPPRPSAEGAHRFLDDYYHSGHAFFRHILY